MFQSPGSIIFKVGFLTIRWYGVMIALGFALASTILVRLSNRLHLDTEKIVNCAFIAFIGGVIGARLYYCALCWQFFQHHPLEILATWEGGLSIHGGIIGGTIAGCFYCLWAKLQIFRLADLLSTVMPLGQSIGRWGNFFNSELFGRPVASDYPLRLYIPPQNRPPIYSNDAFFHPAFLYESAWDLCLFLLLYFFVLPKTYRYPGITFIIYIAGYSLGRMLIEPIRVDSIIVSGAQAPFVVSAISLVLAIVALPVLIFHYYKTGSKEEKANNLTAES
jgi:phosphatidylglycerol:prolipoprotein diacylglycerol transferase